MLASSEPTERLRAIELLASYGDPRTATRILGSYLPRTAYPDERRAMIRAIARMGRPEVVSILAAARRTVHERELYYALASFPTDESVRELVAALADPIDANLARDCLIRVGARAVPRLLRALRDPALLRLAAEVLGSIGDRRATLGLIEVLSSVNATERGAAIQALARLRDDRAIPALLAHRADVDPGNRLLVLQALGALGARDARSLFEDAIRSDSPGSAAVAIGAWMQADPIASRAEVLRLVNGPESAARDAARAQLLRSTDAGWAPTLASLFATADDKEAVAFALARTDGGAGIPYLVQILSTDSAGAAYVALGVALRTWSEDVTNADRESALRAMVRHRDAVPVETSYLARALARDSDIIRWLVEGLRSSSASRRAVCAWALELSPDASARPALRESLRTEQHPEAFRRIAMALVAAGGSLSPELLWSRLSGNQIAPEILILLSRSLPGASERDRRMIREAMRRGLRAPDARTRAAAARALAIAHEVAATGALLHALEDSNVAVRVAAIRALATLRVTDATRLAIRAVSRTEQDGAVYELLRSVADGSNSDRHDSLAYGSHVLVARWINHSGVNSAHATVDIVLNDGRWLRVEPAVDGYILEADLVSGDANVFASSVAAGAR